MHCLNNSEIVNKMATTKLLDYKDIPEGMVFVIKIDDNPLLKDKVVIITSEKLFNYYKKCAYKRKRWYLLDKGIVLDNSTWDGTPPTPKGK